jgi:hypothetical protein
MIVSVTVMAWALILFFNLPPLPCLDHKTSFMIVVGTIQPRRLHMAGAREQVGEDVLGLITTIRSTADPPFPVVRPLLCALVILTGDQGNGEPHLRIFHDPTGRVIFRSSLRQVRFVGTPEAVLGIVFRNRNCSFPMAGLSWVEAVFAGSVISRQ